MAKLYKRGEKYYADLRAVGLGRVSLKTGNRKVAEARMRELELGTTSAAVEHEPLAIVIDRAIRLKKPGTRDFYQSKAAALFRWFEPTMNAHSIERDQVEQYIAERLEEVKRHTVQKELVLLRQALKRIDRAHVVPPFSADYKPRERYLTRTEFKRLITAAAPSRRIWIALAVHQGANAGEIRRLEWKHVNLEDGWITIPGNKRDTRQRTIPITADMRPWLEQADPDEPLVPSWIHGNRYRDMKRFCERAQIEYTNFDDLRRTFASWLKQEGVDSLTVAQLMGHRSTTMVDKVYGKLDADSLLAAVRKLPRVSGQGA
jgi:integrase